VVWRRATRQRPHRSQCVAEPWIGSPPPNILAEVSRANAGKWTHFRPLRVRAKQLCNSAILHRRRPGGRALSCPGFAQDAPLLP
jgi:hypothetical protein